jgi:hypothetical protein
VFENLESVCEKLILVGRVVILRFLSLTGQLWTTQKEANACGGHSALPGPSCLLYEGVKTSRGQKKRKGGSVFGKVENQFYLGFSMTVIETSAGPYYFTGRVAF